jgi:hypothetical protein
VMVLKKVDPVVVPVSAPATFTTTAAPVSSVPVTLNDIPESSAELRIVIFRGSSNVTAPPEANAPPRTKLALLATAATADTPSVSAAAALINDERISEAI